MKVTTDNTKGEGQTLSTEHVHEKEMKHQLWGHFRITCMLGRGRGRVPAHDLRSSSRARLSISNCLSCSRTEASREAVLAHCSIHTLRVEQRTGQGRINTTEQRTFHQHQHLLRGQRSQSTDQEPWSSPLGGWRSRQSVNKAEAGSKSRSNLREKDGESWQRKSGRKEDEQERQQGVICSSY